jgi:hypothetical protein
VDARCRRRYGTIRSPAPSETCAPNAPMERVSRSELNVDPTVVGFLPGDRPCCVRHVNAQNRQARRQSQRRDMKSVLAGPAARVAHRPTNLRGCQTRDGWLRPSNMPWRRAVMVRRIPGQSRQPFVVGCRPLNGSSARVLIAPTTSSSSCT